MNTPNLTATEISYLRSLLRREMDETRDRINTESNPSAVLELTAKYWELNDLSRTLAA